MEIEKPTYMRDNAEIIIRLNTLCIVVSKGLFVDKRVLLVDIKVVLV